jgi:hypothetical protein
MKVRGQLVALQRPHKKNQLLMQVVEQMIIHPSTHSCLLLFDDGNSKHSLFPKEKVRQK